MDTIWYAAYGSNLDRDRFLCYIRGGIAPGASNPNRGCTDQTEPREDRASTIPHRLYFARHSPNWNGGVAFVDPKRSDAETITRLWLVTVEQFTQIAEQENGVPENTISIDPETLETLERDGRYSLLGDDRYSLALHCGRVDGLHVLTITSPAGARTTPSQTYLDTMARGLRESHGLTGGEADAYLEQAMR